MPPPYAYRCPFGTQDAHECGERAARAVDECISAEGAGRVVAVAMEPNAGSNGIVAPDNFWPALRSVTASHGVWLVADEVMSAFGRCGEWFAWQRHGEAGRPDAMTLAKGLTGAAVPLGAVVLSADIARRLEHRSLQTGLTYCGHPLACAAGVAALRAYEDEGLIERSRRMGPAVACRARAAPEPASGDRRRAWRSRSVRGRRARRRPHVARAARALAADSRPRSRGCWPMRWPRACRSARAATCC